MRPAEVLKKMRELHEAWRKQSFKYTREQQAEYDKLLKLRRERVSMFIKTGRVSKGGLKKKETEQTAPES